MKRVLNVLVGVLLTANIFGQATQTMSYLAVLGETNTDLFSLDETNTSPNELSPYVETHYVGEFYGGGIVFYVDEEGKHGLITTTIDKSTRKQQLNEMYSQTKSLRDGALSGKQNTDLIYDADKAGAYKSQVVKNYQEANLGDWYLPTRYDLIRLYLNRGVIGGYAQFANGWKSTEVNSVNEWFKSFVTGAEFSNGKDDEVYLRVIRKF